MRLRALTIVVLLLAAGLSCSRDPEVVKRKYVESGNKYFERGQYKEASIMYRQALRKDMKYGEAYHRLAMTELKLGRSTMAVRSLRRAIELLPNDPAPKVLLADIYLSALLIADRGQTKQVEFFRGEIDTLSKQLLKANPNSVPGLRLAGYHALSERNLKEAIAKFRAADGIAPMKREILLPLAQTLFADGQGEEAERIAKGLLAKEKTVGPAYDLLYVYYVKNKRLKEAEEILQSKVAANPKRAQYVLQLAGHYYGAQRRPEMQQALEKLTSNLKDFPSAHLAVGSFYHRVRDFDAAISHYDLGIRHDPKQKGVYQRRKAQALIDRGDRARAVQLLEQVLKENADDFQAQAMRAALVIETGTKEEVQTAVSELQASVARMPENPVLRYNLGRALLRKGEVEQARIQFQEASKRQANYLPPQLALAELYLGRRDFGQAVQTSRKVLELDSRNLPARLFLGYALMGLGNFEQARVEVTNTIKEHPNSREAVLQLGALDLADKRYQDAEKTFLKVYQTAPEDLRGLMGLTEAYAAQKQLDKAAQMIKAELQKAPEKTELHLAMANLAARSGQFDVAISEYRKLIEKDPGAGQYYLRMGEAQRLKGDLNAAMESFRKASQLLPNEPAAHMGLALLLDAQGRRSEAKTTYEKILRIQPDHAITLNNLAYILAETGGDLDQALTYAQRAKQKLPQNLDVADTLGWIYIKKNLSDNAIEIFRDLTSRAPGVSTFHYHLAMALYQKGDKPQARKALQSALNNRPSPEEAAKIKELMAKVS